METMTTMAVNKDGNGTITLKVHVSEQAMMQMAGAAAEAMAGAMAEAMGDAMGEMAEGMSEAMGAEFEGEDLGADVKMEIEKGMAEAGSEMAMESKSLYDEAMVKALAQAFGPGVRFVSGQESTNKKGWQGFVAQYAFDDVSQVVLSPEIAEVLMGAQQGAAEFAQMEGYSFELAGGEINQLVISQPEAADEIDEDVAEEMTGEAQSMDMGGEAMEQQMLAAMKGKRDTIVIAVEGNITETDAPYRSRRNPGAVILYHFDFDKVMSDAEGKELIESGASPFEMADAGLPGVRVLEEGKSAFVKFK